MLFFININFSLYRKKEGQIKYGVILSTCNRMEFYASFADEKEQVQEKWERMEQAVCLAKGMPVEMCRKYGNCYNGENALVHLHRVACGMDSMVLGEDEILGQVKEACALAMEEGCTDFYLNTIFKSAITCAKKIKTDTDLSRTSVSVATLAAGKILRFKKEQGLSEMKVMIIGVTGQVGNTLMKNICTQEGIIVKGTSRQHNSAGRVLALEGVQMVSYQERYKEMGDCQAVVSATGSPHYTVTAGEWKNAVKQAEKPGADVGKVLFLDLSVPADIDRNVEKEGALLYGIDYFKELAYCNNKKKLQEKEIAALMIEKQVDTLKKELLFHEIMPELAGLKEKAGRYSFEQVMYRIRDNADYADMKGFFAAIKKALGEEEE